MVLRRKQCDMDSAPSSTLMYQPSGPKKLLHLLMLWKILVVLSCVLCLSCEVRYKLSESSGPLQQSRPRSFKPYKTWRREPALLMMFKYFRKISGFYCKYQHGTETHQMHFFLFISEYLTSFPWVLICEITSKAALLSLSP